MRRILLLAGLSASALAAATPARAQMAVFDATLNNTQLLQLGRDIEAAAKRLEMINNQLIAIKNLEDTLSSVRHGNLAALGTLASEMGALGFTSPLGADAASVFQSLSRLGGDLSLTATVSKGIVADGQYFASSGTDSRALWLNNVAQVLATQKQMAQTSLNSTMAYQTKLANLRRSLGSTSDIKAATDAGARLQGETAQQVANSNQMLALIYQQRVQEQLQQAQQEQQWRCWTEVMHKQAQARLAAAQSGQVMLTSALSGSCQSGSTSDSLGTATTSSLTADMTGSVFLTSTSSSGSTVADDGSVLSVMTNQSWGQQAATNATTMGVNPTALAATCVLESNCRSNVGGTGTISGTFQMSNGTYNEAVQRAVSANPDLATQISGKNDPVSQSVAASQYLLQGAQMLQQNGISSPSVLDVRSYYQFGPANAAAVASAPGNQLMSSVLTGLSQSALTANNITANTTVDQWRNTVSNKIGGAASQPVLLGSLSNT